MITEFNSVYKPHTILKQCSYCRNSMNYKLVHSDTLLPISDGPISLDASMNVVTSTDKPYSRMINTTHLYTLEPYFTDDLCVQANFNRALLPLNIEVCGLEEVWVNEPII